MKPLRTVSALFALLAGVASAGPAEDCLDAQLRVVRGLEEQAPRLTAAAERAAQCLLAGGRLYLAGERGMVSELHVRAGGLCATLLFVPGKTKLGIGDVVLFSDYGSRVGEMGPLWAATTAPGVLRAPFVPKEHDRSRASRASPSTTPSAPRPRARSEGPWACVVSMARPPDLIARPTDRFGGCTGSRRTCLVSTLQVVHTASRAPQHIGNVPSSWASPGDALRAAGTQRRTRLWGSSPPDPLGFIAFGHRHVSWRPARPFSCWGAGGPKAENPGGSGAKPPTDRPQAHPRSQGLGTLSIICTQAVNVSRPTPPPAKPG